MQFICKTSFILNFYTCKHFKYKKPSARSTCKSSNLCCYNFPLPDSVINEVGKSDMYKKREYDVSEGLTEEEYREVELVLNKLCYD